MQSEELAARSQPSTSLAHRGSHTLNWLPFCLQSFESIFRVLYFPFLFKNKNCLRYIEFCFGRTQCVFPTLRPLVLSLPVSVCLDWFSALLHASEDYSSAGADARFCLAHLSFVVTKKINDIGVQNMLLQCCHLETHLYITVGHGYHFIVFAVCRVTHNLWFLSTPSLPPMQTLKWGTLLEAIPVRKWFSWCYSVESTVGVNVSSVYYMWIFGLVLMLWEEYLIFL